MFDQNTNAQNDVSDEEALAALVGEGKKYATPAALAKAALHAGNHISVMEAELADLRSRGDISKEVLELLKTKAQTPTQQQAPTQDQGNDKQVVDVSKVVEEQITARLSAQTATENQSKVIAHFQQQFGVKAGDLFNKLAVELEMDKKQLEQMSSERPGAVIKLATQLLGTGQAQPSAASLTGDASTARMFGGSTSAPATKSEIIKKATDEKWPRDKKYQMLNLEMSKAAREGRLDAWNR